MLLFTNFEASHLNTTMNLKALAETNVLHQGFSLDRVCAGTNHLFIVSQQTGDKAAYQGNVKFLSQIDS